MRDLRGQEDTQSRAKQGKIKENEYSNIYENQQQMHLQPAPFSSLPAPEFCGFGTICIVVVYPNGNFCATPPPLDCVSVPNESVSTFERDGILEKAAPVQ